MTWTVAGAAAETTGKSGRSVTAEDAITAFEATSRGQAEKDDLAIARERHGLPPGLPVPHWTQGAPHVNLTLSPEAQQQAQSSGSTPGSLNDLRQPNGPAGKAAEPIAPPPSAPTEQRRGLGTVPQRSAMFGLNSEMRGGEVPPLRNLGGVVQHRPNVHLLFWGSNWSGKTGEMLGFFQGLSHSPYQGILTQYWDSHGYITDEASITSHLDSRVTAPKNVNLAAVREELAAAEFIWGPPNIETQYVILPAPGSTYDSSFAAGYCAFHDVAASGAIYAFVPYEGDEPWANENHCPWYGHEDPLKATTVLASHEYAEMATDPLWDTAPGWRNRSISEGEIADLCATPGDVLPSGVTAHGLYDDHLAGCSSADPNPPHVLGLTEPPTFVTANSATINGTVNPEGLPTTYLFEWGATTAYGQVYPASPQSVGSGWGDVRVSAHLSGLETEHVYHYRVVAWNPSGPTFGEDHTFVPSKWQIATPATGSWTQSWLNGVSCSSEASCMAVGAYYDPGLPTAQNRALSYLKSGAGWTLKNVPLAESESFPDLRDVWCAPGGAACVAVGRVQVSEQLRALIVRWNGSSWSKQPLPLPPGSLGVELEGVSCIGVLAQECIAVGATKSAAGVWLNYTAAYANGAWSTLSTPSPGAAVSAVSAVDCRGTLGSCIAVGWYNPAPGVPSKPFSLVFSASGQWVLQTRSWSGYLEGITCRTFNETCIAVGSDYDLGGPSTETWNGSWSNPTTVNLPDFAGGFLTDVSCRAAADCTAVGGGWSKVLDEAEVSLSENLDGSAWREWTTPRESEVAPNWLSGVDCVGATCVAVGLTKASDNYQALLETGCSCNWAQRDSNSSGPADRQFFFGTAGVVPVAGDWNGDGIDSPGTYDPATGNWFMRDANSAGPAGGSFTFGAANLVPLVGDWNGDGIDTPGVYDPASGVWWLRNSNSSGTAQITFTFGSPNLLPVAGDWNGDGIDTPGVYNPANGVWSLRNSNTTGPGQLNFTFGNAGWAPVVGDWNKDGIDTPGLFVKATGAWYLRNSNTTGPGEVNFTFAASPVGRPVAGDWNGDGTETIGVWK